MELCLPPQQLGCPQGVPGRGCWVQRWEGLVLTRAPVFGDSLMGLSVFLCGRPAIWVSLLPYRLILSVSYESRCFHFNFFLLSGRFPTFPPKFSS